MFFQLSKKAGQPIGSLPTNFVKYFIENNLVKIDHLPLDSEHWCLQHIAMVFDCIH